MLYANGADHAGTFLYKVLLQETPESVHTSLHLAAMHGDKFSIRSLSLLGHDINQRDNEAKTPTHHAAVNGRLEVVEFLVKEAGADVESKDSKYGMTPLSRTAYNGQLEAVKFLVEQAGADVASKDNWDQTALDLARLGLKYSWKEQRCRAVAAWLESRITTYEADNRYH